MRFIPLTVMNKSPWDALSLMTEHDLADGLDNRDSSAKPIARHGNPDGCR
jgi:hypothetical protein